MKCDLKFVIAFFIFSSLIYGSGLFVVWTAFCLFNENVSWLGYIIPLAIYIVFLIFLSLGMCCSECLFSFTFFIFGIYLGYLLYIFMTSIIIKVVDACIDIPSVIGMPILTGVPFIICLYGYINAKITRIVRHTLKFEGYRKSITILHLSDIHLGCTHQKSSIERIVEETEKLNPDIVVITGDMADGSIQVKDEWLKPFDKLTMPILYITGNHEMMNPKLAMLNSVSKTNIKYIGNNGTFSFNGVNFIGVDFDFDLKSCLEEVKQEEGVPNVLLCHVPTMKAEELAKYNIFLFLAGHTHGGQFFPFQIPAYAMNACFSGLYSDKENKHHVYVSDGVNNAVVPMRIGSRRIFAMITITGTEEQSEK